MKEYKACLHPEKKLIPTHLILQQKQTGLQPLTWRKEDRWKASYIKWVGERDSCLLKSILHQSNILLFYYNLLFIII